MGVEAIDGRGVNRAKVICDTCGRAEVVTCDYERVGQKWEPNAGQAARKMVAHGWAEVKGRLSCPKCEAKRRAKAAMKGSTPMDTKTKPADTPLRRPSPKQERLIILALEDAYDDQAKRFKGGATDKTLADELGDGIMFGWVAEIRERLFGPSGGNEELDAIKADVQKLQSEFDARIAAMAKRIDAVVAAVGPRAR